MKTLEGIAKHPGAAIAIVAQVDSKTGINGLPSSLLMEGISALRKGTAPADYPEAILACDTLQFGATVRIPGITLVGIVAESPADVEYGLNIPCVVGAVGLLQSVNEGDILIVDGNKGRVHIDPDPSTLIHYQHAEEQRNLREKVFISSEHIPARTQTGEVIYVYAVVANQSQLIEALNSGADGIFVDLRSVDADPEALAATVLREVAGKPVYFVVEYGCEEVLRAAMTYCTPSQLTLVSTNPDLLSSQVDYALDRIVLEALQLDIDPPEVELGSYRDAGDEAQNRDRVVDCRDGLCSVDPNEPVVAIVGEQMGLIDSVIRAGARRIAVDRRFVGRAKQEILTIEGP
ncbi:MAG: hypothetical protein ACOX3G_04410 [Armatimonadota bacterium]|jgi:hypothetical protein